MNASGLYLNPGFVEDYLVSGCLNVQILLAFEKAQQGRCKEAPNKLLVAPLEHVTIREYRMAFKIHGLEAKPLLNFVGKNIGSEVMTWKLGRVELQIDHGFTCCFFMISTHNGAFLRKYCYSHFPLLTPSQIPLVFFEHGILDNTKCRRLPT